MRHDREKIYIYGKHALEEALASAPRAIKRVLLAPDLKEPTLKEAIRRHNIPMGLLKGREASRMVGSDAVHQGVIAIADPGSILKDFTRFAAELKPTEDTMLVLLDELTDPHNVGAIIRSAAAFGAAGVLMPVHNQAPITGAVVKASVGMVFRVPIVSIGNVNYTVDTLKKMGFKTYALVMNGKKNIAEESFDSPALFIIGNEGKGIRQKTLERCDVGLRIPIDARCESLNASVSAAVVLYQWSVRRPGALHGNA